ncbi:MAG: hypothetical protein WD873_08220 [Candidatus Hydrogenedentales bacterium]
MSSIASRNKPLAVRLFGADADELRAAIVPHSSLHLLDANGDDSPDVVVCYGGDGTLLSAELKWPGVPKVPIRNSRRGLRMMDHPPDEILQRLAENRLVPTEFLKVRCRVRAGGNEYTLRALNEINVQLARTNSAVRFQMWIDDEPFEGGVEIIGDGFLVSTPFGSTAYYKQITRGIFYTGLGIALKFTSELVNHFVVKEDSVIRARITRGPASMANDNAAEEVHLVDGDEMVIAEDLQNAVVLAWEALRRPSEEL